VGTRRIVTGTDADGRSYFVSDGAAPGAAGFGELWQSNGAEPLAPIPSDGAPPVRLEPPPGGSSWRVFDLPPDEVVAAYLASQNVPEVEASGFHRTDTLDYVMVLDGEVTLELDRGEVALRPGDCVVQRATRHAWRNRSGRPVRLAVVMIRLPAEPSAR
jgi:mannose-6-phosphate isomerase-like protein (cupin superfamily)